MPPYRPPSCSLAAALAVGRALAGSVLAVLVLAGTPMLLVGFVGNPLPTAVPSWDGVSHALSTGSIEPATWLKGVAVFAWVAWASLVASFAVELVAVVKGKATTAIRGLGTAQWLAAKLVAQWTLAGSLLFGPGAGATATSLGTVPLVFDGFDQGEPALVVARGPVDGAAAGYLPRADITVERGDNLWRLSDDRLERLGPDPGPAEVAAYVDEVFDWNLDQIDDPDLIFPGQVVTFPQLGGPADPPPYQPPEAPLGAGPGADPGGVTSGPALPPLPDRQGVATAESGAAAPAHHEATEQGGAADELLLVSLGAAGGVLAAGGLGALRRRRRYRLAQRRPGTRPAPPCDDLVRIEQVLGWQAEPELRDWLHAAFSSLGGRPIWEGEEAAQPLLGRLGDDYLEVEYTEADPVAAPLPWSPSAGGLRWRLEWDDELVDPPGAASELEPLPAMVTIGTGTFCNLEAAGVLAITGEGDGPMALVRSIVHELATSPTAGICDVRSTIPIPGTEAYDLVQVQAPGALVAELVPWLDDITHRLAETRSVNAYAHRLVTSGDPVGPVVVVTGTTDAAELTPIIAAAEARNLPLALVVVGGAGGTAGTVDSSFSIEVSGRQATVQPWDLTIEAQAMSAEAARQLGELLSDAASSATVLLEPTGPPPDLRPPAPDEAAIVVRVLGDVTVEGAANELTSQQLSLVCYLACNGPASRAAVIGALWDGQQISASRFPNLLTETRARLGRHHFPEARDGRYELAGVTTDLARFEQLVAAAGAQSSAGAVDLLRQALGLVRGVPFTPPSRRFWTWVGDTTHHSARVEAVVADAAAQLAGMALGSGDLGLAQWACEQGLIASPGDETLVTLLVEVYLNLGMPTSAHRLVGDWEESISRLGCGEPSDRPRQRLSDLIVLARPGG